jgi:hypothetical protein
LTGIMSSRLLQGDGLIGRLDVRRAGNTHLVQALWPEPGIRMGAARTSGLVTPQICCSDKLFRNTETRRRGAEAPGDWPHAEVR